MINIQVKAKTENAFKGLQSHYKQCNTFKNKIVLKAHGVTQKLNLKEKSLYLSWDNLITKISKKIHSDFKAQIKEYQQKDFIKHVDNFMKDQQVEPNEYEVIF